MPKKNSFRKNIRKKTLVIVMASTRARSIVFLNFFKYVIEPLNADLALAVSRPPKGSALRAFTDVDSYFKSAKYVWAIDDPYNDDFGVFFEETAKRCYNRSFLDGVRHFRGQQWLGLVKGSKNKGSSGCLIFFRWLTLQGILADGLLNRYTHFVLTRSDHLYTSVHPPVHHLNPGEVWIPLGEGYRGVTDRHTIFHRDDIVRALSLLDEAVRYPPVEVDKRLLSQCKKRPNLEQVLQRHYKNLNLTIVWFPRVMYSVRDADDAQATHWKEGFPQMLPNDYIWAKLKHREDYIDAKKNAHFNWSQWSLINERNVEKELFKSEIGELQTFNKNNTFGFNVKHCTFVKLIREGSSQQRCVTLKQRPDGFGMRYMGVASAIAWAAHTKRAYCHVGFEKKLAHGANTTECNAAVGFNKANYCRARCEKGKDGHFNQTLNGTYNVGTMFSGCVRLQLRYAFEHGMSSLGIQPVEPHSNAINVAVHIRRGDVKNANNWHKARRFLPLSKTLDMMNYVEEKYLQQGKNVFFNVFSEGKEKDFGDLIAKRRNIRLNLLGNDGMMKTFYSLVVAKTLILTTSGFSWSAGLLNSGEVYYPVREWRLHFQPHDTWFGI
eukprot:CAMPEP_0167744188 /NCGR_PEP_ID=MMETSP0110_2-20121227/2445_1 /TAXON_ID=629695 /ORGANISM="Gymnochlora sp., Strain CCMP2014" /LENGTH=605 /DNA_ID=CAMNT_0007628667 /DNA_START=434 /DNA_END=2251 /DNA_ORIENTATION=+